MTGKLERYRPTMTVDVLHAWASDAQDEIDRLLEWQNEAAQHLEGAVVFLHTEGEDDGAEEVETLLASVQEPPA